MKKLVLLIVLILPTWSAMAQSTEFEFAPHDSVAINPPAPPEPMEQIADLEIHSLAATEISVKWQRNVQFITPGCLSKVCDLLACYPPSFNTRTFPLGSGVTGPISVHIENPANVLCQAVVHIEMWNVDIPDAKVNGYYLFNMTNASGVNDPAFVPEAKVFPNPTAEYFSIDAVDGMSRVRLIDLTGREVAVYDSTGAQSFLLNHLQTGQYLVLVEDKLGKALAVAQISVL